MPHTARLLVRDVLTVQVSETISGAAKLMKKNHIGCVVITDTGKGDGKPIGIFTERDMVNRVAAEDVNVRSSVAKVMTPNPVTVDAAEPIDKIFKTLADGRFRHVPITDGGKLVGIVSLSDMAGVLREVFLQDQYTQYLVDYLQHGVVAKG